MRPTITIDLGQLYADSHLDRALRSRRREQEMTLELIAETIESIHALGYDIHYHLGGLVGQLTRDSRFSGKRGELREALGKVLSTVRRLEKARPPSA